MTANVKIVRNFERVKKVVHDSVIATFGDAARIIRSIARKSIRRKSGGRASLPGEPPRTRFGQLRNSIIYDVDKKREEAIIGPAFSRVGPVASALEHGGMFRGADYEARPFMRPAFERISSKLPKLWRYSIR